MEKKRVILYWLGFLILLGALFLPGFTERQKLREKNDELERRIVLLEEHNKELEEELIRLQQEPEYVERKAREKLGIVKKGEIIYRGEGRE